VGCVRGFFFGKNPRIDAPCPNGFVVAYYNLLQATPFELFFFCNSLGGKRIGYVLSFCHSIPCVIGYHWLLSYSAYFRLPHTTYARSLTLSSSPALSQPSRSASFTYEIRVKHIMYIPHGAAMALHKRDNMGFQISPAAIILLVILGAGFLVCCGFAIVRFYGGTPDEQNWTKRVPEQDAYMREVRRQNRDKLARQGARYLRPAPSYDLAHAPALSPR
jgi:hypothetical protein